MRNAVERRPTMTGLRVILATDGSAGSDDALTMLISTFKRTGVAEIEVLAVVPQETRWPAPGREDHGPIMIIDAAHCAAAEATVQAAVERLKQARFRAWGTALAGHPAETIVLHATAERSDLVVVGTRSLGAFRRQVVSSVSSKVARYAPISVLVARTADPIRRIVLGYDASPDAELALDLVARLPFRDADAVTVCTVYESVAPLASGIAPTMVAQVHAAHQVDLDEARGAAEAVAAEGARHLRERGVPAGHRAIHGTPHEHLAIAVRESSADLLVVGSRGLSGVERFFLGSTSAALVAHPPASVLIARGTPGGLA
jgi:nucleotide-binding universal stress UspA family protein